MSINAHFREISPGLLTRIQRDPSLTRTVILGTMNQGPWANAAASHYDRLFSKVPTKEREDLKAALDRMSPGERAMALGVTKLLQLFSKVAGAAAVDAAALAPGELGETLGLHKEWHGLHFLLTAGATDATPSPLGQAILGGVEIGEDTGYGQPRYLDPDAVAATADALAAVDASDLSRRFDARAMMDAKIYPGDWADADRKHLLGAFDELLAFYRSVAGRANAALLYHI